MQHTFNQLVFIQKFMFFIMCSFIIIYNNTVYNCQKLFFLNKMKNCFNSFHSIKGKSKNFLFFITD